MTEFALDRDELLRRWNALAADPDSPDHFELDELGELILAPNPTNDHQLVVAEVARQIAEQLGPRAAAEISVYTDRGIRVPGVVWMPADRWREVKGQSPCPFAPALCVEVFSLSNSRAEIAMKIGAYLRAGAREVIIVGLDGSVDHFDAQGRRDRSALGVALALPSELF
jgi:Uma2 family endonuclease